MVLLAFLSRVQPVSSAVAAPPTAQMRLPSFFSGQASTSNQVNIHGSLPFLSACNKQKTRYALAACRWRYWTAFPGLKDGSFHSPSLHNRSCSSAHKPHVVTGTSFGIPPICASEAKPPPLQSRRETALCSGLFVSTHEQGPPATLLLPQVGRRGSEEEEDSCRCRRRRHQNVPFLGTFPTCLEFVTFIFILK